MSSADLMSAWENFKMESNQYSWHLDKRVPVALIVTIVFQTAIAIWWASSIDTQVETNASAISTNAARTEILRENSQVQAVQLGRIEEQLIGLRGDIERLVRALEDQ